MPIVIEVGRLWRCLVHLDVTSMSMDVLSVVEDTCNCKSSANEWIMIQCVSITADKA